MLSVAKAMCGPCVEASPSKESKRPEGAARDPLQELRELEGAFEQFQEDDDLGGAAGVGFAFDDEEWDRLSSGSE